MVNTEKVQNTELTVSEINVKLGEFDDYECMNCRHDVVSYYPGRFGNADRCEFDSYCRCCGTKLVFPIGISTKI